MKTSRNSSDKEQQPDISSIISYLEQHSVKKGEIDAAVILGSGLGDFAAALVKRTDIPYGNIPGMPEVTVAGHSGMLHIGKIDNKKVIAFGGRFHGYEGHSMELSLVLVHICHALSIDKLLISNAAGGVSTRLHTGDLMLINDFMSPGYAFASKGHPRSLTRFDNYNLRPFILELAAMQGIPLQHGTYFYVKGPTYETKAEVRAYRSMGADVVGMSTAPEMLEATRLGIRHIVGISLVTNMATGVSQVKLDHSEVKETAESRKKEFAKLICELIKTDLPDSHSR
ncbi:MAG: purine-nucleoside phosphorylase [Balneolales bacterium]|nr:purine-nucleoside phosphorylase [Balneolales bacterium]